MKLHRLAYLALPVVIFAAACGDEATVGTTPDPTVAEIPHPTGADEVVLQLTVAGGFVPVELAFATMPTITIYGDGRVITPGAVTMIYPGPLVMPLFERTISEEGLQLVLAAAEEAGLLAPPPSYDSSGADSIADVPTTELVLDAGGGRFVHAAYALSEVPADTPERQRLLDFVTSLGNLEQLAGADALGAEEPFVADQYRIRAVADPQPQDLEPTVVPWPDPAVNLADAAECAVASGPEVTAALTEANQLTWFTQDGVTYSLMVRPLLPGDPAC